MLKCLNAKAMSYLTLYRKYRPQLFAEVLGQPHVIKTLQNALALGKVAHAYLFCGPRGVGKTTVARLLARAVNCKNLKKVGKEGIEPCNKCEACKEMIEGRAIDLIEIDAASNRGIDEIRDLREKVKFTPLRLKYKIFIVDEVHMLTQEAFNALLKTLEEPPAHILFILATTEPYRVPATIISRCQRFDFRKLTLADLILNLKRIAKKEKIKIDDKALKLIALESSGSSRDALSLFGQMISLEDEEITFEEVRSILGIADLSFIFKFVDFLVSKDAKQAIALVNKIADSGFDLKQFSKKLLEYFRKLLLIKIDLDLAKSLESDLTEEQFKKACDHAQKISAKDLVNQIKFFIRAKKEIDDSVIPELPLEIALIESLSDKLFNEGEKKHQTNGGEKPHLDDSKNSKKKIETFNQKLSTLPDQQSHFAQDRIISANSQSIKPASNLSTKSQFCQSKKAQFKESCDKQFNVTKNTFTCKDINLIEINFVQKRWNDFVQTVRKYNFSLSAFLKFCEPIEIKKSKLILLCQYPFYRERLKDLKNKKLIEDVAVNFFKSKIFFEFILYRDLDKDLRKKYEDLKNKKKKEAEQAEALIKKALDVFGEKTA